MRNTMQKLIRETGFSLIEINLAIFLVAMGMLTLFSLFPAGLKQVETAHESTQEALFADYVISTLRADSMALDAAGWVAIDSAAASTTFPDFTFNSITSESFPAGSGLYMRYLLQINRQNAHVWSVTLWCRSGQYGSSNLTDFKAQASKFYTEVFYSGMP